jgi:hypothetical protein
MTPKKKALQLVENMAFNCKECDYEMKAKQCALIAVHEILQMIDESMKGFLDSDIIRYWLEVKTEIEKL